MGVIIGRLFVEDGGHKRVDTDRSSMAFGVSRIARAVADARGLRRQIVDNFDHDHIP